jgi:hypothetical protein
MAKIKINKLPEGFELKKGKVVKTMQQGGATTGDQSGYGLVTDNLTPKQFNDEDGKSIRYSLSSVPRDMANIEAEGGETVLTDLNDDGQFGLYNITGPRHGSGGVPMFLPEQSFVFSDTQKMKLNRGELAEFGIESKKKMTPAQISKKYQLNEFIGAMDSEDVDPIKFKSAELMIDKNQNKLSKLAFAQESKKNFEDGVPLASHPYLVSMGIDPMEFTQKVENITREQAAQRMLQSLPPEEQAKMAALQQMMAQAGQQQQMPMAQDGSELPKAQDGENDYKSFIYDYTPPTVARDNTTVYQPRVIDFEQMNEQFKKAAEEDNARENKYFGWTSSTDDSDEFDFADFGITSVNEDAATQNTNTNTNANTNTNTKSNTNTERRTTGRQIGGRKINLDGFKGGRSLGSGYKQYQELERLFTSDSPEWKETTDRAYAAFKANALAQGIPEDQIPTKDVAMQNFLKYQENNYKIQDLVPDEYRYATQLDKGSNKAADVKKNENTQKLFNRTAELYPDQYEAYQIDDATTKMNQLFFQAVTLADNESDNPNLNYIASGPNQKGNWADNKTISKAEGYYGNNTLNQTLQVKEPKKPEPKKEKEEEKKEFDIPEVKSQIPLRPEYWTQDLNNLAAIAMRDREMFLPWQPAVEIPKADYVLEEPTRQLADVNEQLNIITQGAASFGNPQAFNARASQAQGKAFAQNANTFAQVHQRNIGTVNRGLAMNAQLEAGAKREQRDRDVKLYDDTQLTLQNYMDEKNLDREQYTGLMNTAITNRANTANLNTLYPYFNIDPTTGGMIDVADNLPALVANKSAANTNNYGSYTERANAYSQLQKDGFSEEDIKTIMGSGSKTAPAKGAPSYGADPYADALRMIRETGMPAGYPGTTAKKGKEIKKYVVPFYTGKTGY